MNRFITCLFGCSAIALPLLATQARANSITAYGVIVTALGSDGLNVQTTDQSDPKSGEPLFQTSSNSAAKGGVLVMPDGNGGVTVMPYDAVACPTMPSPTNPSSPEQTPAASGGTGNDQVGEIKDPEIPPPVPDDILTEMPPRLDDPPINPEAGSTGDPDSNPPTTGTDTPSNPSQTPEPASMTLLALAGLGAVGVSRRRRKA